MFRHRSLFALTLPLLICLSATSAPAEEVIEAWRGDGFSHPQSVSVNPTDGSCWVGDGGDVVHLSEDGPELWRGGKFSYPASVSVNSTGGSCWVADWGGVMYLAADGTEVWRSGDFTLPESVSANPADGSCWVADGGGDRVVHLAEDGTELLRVFISWPTCVSVDSNDGSCWVVAQGDWQVVHLAENGAELWRGNRFDYASSLSVNYTDGSCWVADAGPGTVVHFDAQGGELWRGAIGGAFGVSVNSADGSCWVADLFNNQVVHLAQDGTELWRGGGFNSPHSVSANPVDGSCWVADEHNAQVVRLVIPGWRAPIFYDVASYHWAFEEVEACYNAGIVGGYGDGLYHPELAVTRDQMAVYISRALAGGDEYVPEFTETPTFPDVPEEHWALDYVEYAVERNVVAGYQDGSYHPQYQVTRDQMAVYVARAICDPTGEDGLSGYIPADPRNFPDVPDTFWSYTHVEYCVENGVVAGYLDGLYHPELVVTRDQMAVYVARAFDLGT
jgi:DNA-binding beta-propeller fold protein YncE